MKEIRYQQEAVEELVKKSYDLIHQSGDRKKIVFKAPTGSGKTVMASDMLDRLTKQLATDPASRYREVAYIWIAPNKLHEQSYQKMQTYFTESRVLKPVMYDELDHSSDGYIHHGEILFVNWESINKDKNVMMRDSENGASIPDICYRTKEAGLPIVVIVDEEHMFGGKNAKKSEKVLRTINPKLEVRISATPEPQQTNAFIEVPREKVIREEMIKEGIVINPGLDVNAGTASLNTLLLKHALKRREDIAEAYREQGANINPLLLIQLPNDSTATMTADENSLKEELVMYLDRVHGINIDNGKLAIWLSGEKDNLGGIERFDNITEVLLFKQAIALGWDCPRAAVLLIYRKMESFQFTTQTVGRILRMPEQKFYPNALLNKGYVYTDLAKDKIQIVADDMSYISSDLLAVRRKDLHNVALRSEYSEYKSADRNRLGPDFRKVLEDTVISRWSLRVIQLSFNFNPFDEEPEPNPEDFGALSGEIIQNRKAAEAKGINFNVTRVPVEIPDNVYIEPQDIGIYDIDNTSRIKYARTQGELQMIFDDFCLSLLGGYEKAHSFGVLKNNIIEMMEHLFEVFETDAYRIILAKQNNDKFREVIRIALEIYARDVLKRRKLRKERSFVEYIWEVPEERYYNAANNQEVPSVRNHALMPFVRLNNAYSPEIRFAQFLEDNIQYIDWWYKNGDEGKQHYAISFTNSSNEKELFYPDFVIRLKSGKIFLFDTKTPGSDPEAPAKHNALNAYMQREENKALNLQGGILIEDNNLWRYSQFTIDNTNDLTGWTAFHPDQN